MGPRFKVLNLACGQMPIKSCDDDDNIDITDKCFLSSLLIQLFIGNCLVTEQNRFGGPLNLYYTMIDKYDV